MRPPAREAAPWLRRTMRRWRVVVAGAAFLAVTASGVVWWQLRPAGAGQALAVIVPPGASTWQIGERLTRAGLVRSPRALVLAALLRRATGRLRHGEFLLAPSQSALEIVDVLTRGEVLLHRVTIPEGFTARQVADLLAQAGLADRDRFLDLALRRGRTFARPVLDGLPVDTLEGYLFPDTYQWPRDLGEAELIRQMLDRFDEMAGQELRAGAAARGLTVHQLLTVAAMVEREARVPDERPVIAGVIYNRLARAMRLEIDATVLYALGRHKAVITRADLAVDSPYNTYRRGGLPPGPIANAGLAAIRAAANPAETPYLFYVLRPDGRHHFSRTLEEHLAAVRRYRP